MKTNALLAAALSIAALIGADRAGAQSAPASRWLVAKVKVSGGALTLSRGSSRWSIANAHGVDGILRSLDGSWVYARVTPSGSALDVDAVAGENDRSTWEKVQGATDDHGAIAWIRPNGLFVITGDVTAEEEEGGDLYYDVPVRSGGLSADPHTGYVLAADVRVWSR